VAIVHLPDEMKDAEETVALVEKEGRKCLKFAGDVGKPEVGAGVVVQEPWRLRKHTSQRSTCKRARSTHAVATSACHVAGRKWSPVVSCMSCAQHDTQPVPVALASPVQRECG
jgi:hypothetical protein